MNKKLMLAIILVSMIPGIIASAHGISGFLVANATNASDNNVSSNSSHVVNIVPGAYTVPTSGYATFYALATVLLLIAMAYLLNEYRKDDKKRASTKAIKKIHAINKEKKSSSLNLISSLKALSSKAKSIKLNNDKAEKYMVYLVGAVALVGILVMVLR